MKAKILSFIFLSVLLFSNCGSDDLGDNFEASAIITGPNFGACICCSGWFIEIENVAETKWFESLPEESELDLIGANFPIDVWINWTAIDEGCTSIIIIDDIMRME